jgi:RNA polymerase sigma-54 factor
MAMALTAKLEFRQSQSLVMTPQLQQAIKLLQLSNIELNAYVEAELERNPLLERRDRDDEAPAADEPRAESEVADHGGGDESDSAGSDAPDSFTTLATDEAGTSSLSELDSDYESVYPDAGTPTGQGTPDSNWQSMTSGTSRGFEDDDANIEAYVAQQTTLREHLEQQMHLIFNDPARLMIGQHLIEMIDEAGYLRGDITELAAQLGAPLELVENVLDIMQGFEPTGVFARTLGECLALQLEEQGDLTESMRALTDNLDLLAQHRLTELKRVCKVEADELAEMIQHLRQLDPKPGLQFDHAIVQPVVPDVFVRQLPRGGWHVELNSDTLPRVLVNKSYYTTVSKGTRSDKDKAYLSECLNTANWLTKSLDQRARTILRVAEEIVRQQDAFLAHGIASLRPLNLKTVAEAIQMHESTVSRVTSNKYIGTPRGIFEMKYFFTSAINAAGDGEAHSSEAVRHKIKQLIDAEPPSKVLSDDKIVELLRAEGIDIARRTVAKYREALRIPSSVQRRREKMLVLSHSH